MPEFDDETTPLPPLLPTPRDAAFPTGRQPRIARGALSPHEAAAATTRMWSVTRQADTTRMSAREIAACIPLRAPAEDPLRTMRVEAAVFRPVQGRGALRRWKPALIPILTFAAGLGVGMFVF